MKPILAFSGPIGSGKSRVSKLLGERLGAKWNGFGTTVKEIAQERNVPIKREELQNLGAELIEKERRTFCERVLAPVSKNQNEYGIVDGVRHAEVLDELSRIIAPRPLLSIFVDASQEIRLDRVGKRDGLNAEQLAALDSHSTEIQVKTELRKRANFIANNDGTPDECAASIYEWLSKTTKVA